jgi:hypothetical protein
MAAGLQQGDLVSIHYGQKEWHQRVLILHARELSRIQYDIPRNSQSAWWVLSTGGDVFVEDLVSDEEQDVRMLDRHGEASSAPAGRKRPGFSWFDTKVSFSEVPSTREFATALVVASTEEAGYVAESVAGGTVTPSAAAVAPLSDDHTLPEGLVWKTVAAHSDGSPGEVVSPSPGKFWIVRGGYALVQAGGDFYPAVRCRASDTLIGALGMAAVVEDEDVRVLPVKWKGDKRSRPFAESIDLMQHYDYGDSGLEGEDSADWYLDKIVSTGLDPVARSRAWSVDSHIPSGDRSVHEHFVISKVLDTAARIDQINLKTLVCFELLIRRAQVIENAHALNPSNPEYGPADDLMGWGVQRGGALVAPSLSKHAAAKATERYSVIREQRKFAEEMRLKKVPARQPGKGSGKGNAEAAAA